LHKKAFLRRGKATSRAEIAKGDSRGTTQWWKEPAELEIPINFIVTRSPSVTYGAGSLPEGAFATRAFCADFEFVFC